MRYSTKLLFSATLLFSLAICSESQAVVGAIATEATSDDTALSATSDGGAHSDAVVVGKKNKVPTIGFIGGGYEGVQGKGLSGHNPPPPPPPGKYCTGTNTPPAGASSNTDTGGTLGWWTCTAGASCSISGYVTSLNPSEVSADALEKIPVDTYVNYTCSYFNCSTGKTGQSSSGWSDSNPLGPNSPPPANVTPHTGPATPPSGCS